MIHSILIHWPAATVDEMDAYLRKLDPSVEVWFAYGGSRDDFARIQCERKLFIEEPSLRGSTAEQNYLPWMTAVAQEIRDRATSVSTVYFSECDHLIIRAGYGAEFDRLLQASGCDFLAHGCADRTNTNDHHYLRERNSQKLLTALKSVSVRKSEPVLWGALQSSWLMRWEVLDALTRAPISGTGYTEILVPSAVYQLGYHPGDFSSFSTAYDHVRYRPAFDIDETLAAIKAGAWCVHPFKDISRLREIYSSTLALLIASA